MLAMTPVIVDYMFKNVFLTFHILQAGPTKHCWALGNFPLLSLSTDLCALITC